MDGFWNISIIDGGSDDGTTNWWLRYCGQIFILPVDRQHSEAALCGHECRAGAGQRHFTPTCFNSDICCWIQLAYAAFLQRAQEGANTDQLIHRPTSGAPIVSLKAYGS